MAAIKNWSENRQKGKIIFNIIAYVILTVTVIICVVPFLMVVAGSFSSNPAIIKYGYSIFPREFSLDGYRMIFLFPDEIGRAYLVTIAITIAGTLLGIVVMSMAGYALQRREMKYRNALAFVIYFTTLFNCGLVPWYMLISSLGMKDTLWALVIPMCANSFHILLIRNFMRELPESLLESAKIDGAGEFRIFLKIVLPLSTPIIATVSLFLALAYWNDWYLASLFIKDVTKWPLQYKLYKILSAQMAMTQAGAENFSNATIPTESLKLATAVVATGPIIVLYPFLQRYFVQGITIGAVKG